MGEKYNVQIEDLTPEFRELAEDIGLELALDIVDKRGGEQLYIPSVKTVQKAARDRLIRSEHDSGVGYKELARKHNLSVISIRKITQ
ncbi:hypothetical protein DSCW_26060 [Desulfosarcina widdelii]|uniref:Mor transcription activator domain-containing protein n=1 Tax=Desulfosarcina widdelii TaxID=947919 RepID=A0A5K7Z4R0_9BACT|nr:Mor transcription activator family protein [Desulfosarcina widdelii]BBO75189.1 hypothetical protein DSCW_26060 [Desulfosarcina widdelii]